MSFLMRKQNHIVPRLPGDAYQPSAADASDKSRAAWMHGDVWVQAVTKVSFGGTWQTLRLLESC